MSIKTVKLIVLENWTDEVLAALSAHFAVRKSADGPWAGRWSNSAAYFSWKLKGPPAGPATAALAYDGAAIVGSATVCFKPMRAGGKMLLAGEIGDLYLQDAYRGQGIFQELVRAATDAAFERGAAFVFCVPNAQGFAALLGSGRYEELEISRHATWLCPLQPVSLVAAKLFRATAPPPPSAQAGDIGQVGLIGDLPQVFPARGGGAELAADALWLNHRVAEHPDLALYNLVHFEGGFAVVKDVLAFGRPAVLVGRIFAADDTGLRRGLKAVKNYGRERRALFVAIWGPAKGSVARLLRAGFFWPVQKKKIAISYNPADPDFSRTKIDLRVGMLDSDKI